MSTDITQLTPPSQERLSVTCRALADELAGLIKRTMKLYAEELAIAEATPLTPESSSESPAAHSLCDHGCYMNTFMETGYVPPPIVKKGLTGGLSEIAARKAAAPARQKTRQFTTLGALKGLIQSMESLLRCAKLAREIEEKDPNLPNPTTGLTYRQTLAIIKKDREAGLTLSQTYDKIYANPTTTGRRPSAPARPDHENGTAPNPNQRPP